MSQSIDKYSELIRMFSVAAADSIINEVKQDESEMYAKGILFNTLDLPEITFVRLRCDYCSMKCGKEETKCKHCGAPL